MRCPAAPASCEFSLPFSDMELENFLLKIGHARGNMRRLESRNVELAKDFGRRLFDATFGGEMRGCLRQSLDIAGQHGAGLRLRLHLAGAPELAGVPWEFLYDPSLNRFFVLSGKTPLVRYLDLSERIWPLAVQPPIRILVVMSMPRGFRPLDVDREWARLEEALADLRERGTVIVERLEPPTLAALQRRLRRDEFHIFHFVGHGDFDENAQDGVLLMEDESGAGRAITGQELGTLLHDHASLRLAILNACEGARASRTDPFAGAAQSLVQQGIPAVIAMQFEVADDTAVLFAHEFYGAVADGYPVDTALAEARKAIYAAGNDIEWGTPVLYMRAPDGRIFDLPAAPPAAQRPAPPIAPSASPSPAGPRPGDSQKIEEMEIEALEAYYGEDWPRAAGLYRRIVDLQPDRPGASAKLAAATRNQALAESYAAAKQAYDAQDWPAAVEKLQALVQTDAGYRDAAALLAEARRRAALSELYAEARLLARAESWEAVEKVFERMAALDPTAPDPDGLLPRARERQAAAALERKLSGLYAEGLRLLDAGRPAGAAGQFEAVRALAPEYRQVKELLARARQEVDAARAAEALRARSEGSSGEARPGTPAASAASSRPSGAPVAHRFPAEAATGGRRAPLSRAWVWAAGIGAVLLAAIVISQLSGALRRTPAATRAPAAAGPTAAPQAPAITLPTAAPRIAVQSASGGSLKIAILAPLTGSQSAFGVSTRAGALQAIDEWNARGGVLGMNIQAIVLDSQCTPDAAVNAANRAISQEKVRYIIGDICSGASIAVSEIANAARVVQISPTSVQPDVTVSAGGKTKDYIFRACFTDDVQGSAGARVALENLKAKTAFVMSDQADTYVKTLADSFSKAFIAGGGRIIATGNYDGSKDTDFTVILAKIADARPDVVYLPDYYNVVNLVTKQAKEKGISVPFVGGDGWDSTDLNASAADGGYFTNHYRPDDPQSELQSFIKGYQARYGGKTPDSAATLTYDATNLMLQGIEEAGADDTTKVKDMLAKISFPAVSGQMTFDARHNPVKPVTIVAVKGGKLTFYARVQP